MEKTKDKIPKEQIERGIEFLKKEFSYFNENNLHIEDEEDEIVFIEYPGEDEAYGVSFVDFVFLIYELSKFEIITEGRFHTTCRSYQIVRFENENIQFFLLSQTKLVKEFELGKIIIEDNVDILRFASMRVGAYHEKYGTFHQHYPVVQIEYHDKQNRLSVDDEDKLILSYLFEISDSTGYNISIGKFMILNKELETKIEKIIEKEDDFEEGNPIIKLKPLIDYNEGMDLFISAIQVNDESLKFLNFYKIIEYFAPIIIRLEGNSLLVSKLDNPKVLSPDREFINSIFDLVNSVKENQKDSELGKVVLMHVDIVDIINLLPERIIKHSKGIAKIQEINYETPKEKLSVIISVISNALYSTRNWVVHAKSNYQLTGNEVEKDELEQLNIFMKQLTAKLIRWYEKLPKHQK